MQQEITFQGAEESKLVYGHTDGLVCGHEVWSVWYLYHEGLRKPSLCPGQHDTVTDR